MAEPPMNWAQWPRDGAESAVPQESLEKTASFPDSPPPSIEAVVHSAAQAIARWEPELPSGIEKTAALRDDGSGDRLPPVTQRTLWRHPNTHPLILDILLLDMYGAEYLTWDPEPLRMTLHRDGIQISNSVWTKIQAVRVLHNSPSPWRRWEVFHWISLGLNGRAPNFAFMEEPELGFFAAAVDTMEIIDPPRKTDEEVDKYVAAVAKNEGIVCLPAPLDFAQDELDSPQFLCEKCGTVNRDDNDVRCPACGSDKLKKIPKPHGDICTEVTALFEARKKLPLEEAVDGLPDDTAGNMAHHLLVHWDYRNEVRSRFGSQLRMLRE